MPEAPRTAIGRLILGIEHATGLRLQEAAFEAIPLTEPACLAEAISGHLSDDSGGWEVVVTGTLDRRLALIEHDADHDIGHARDARADAASTWTVVDLSGQPHRTRAWPSWTAGRLTLDDPAGWLSAATVTAGGAARLLSPKLLLVALYHPEYFPLPRFPLGISGLARAARATLLGQVDLMDMQLGHSLDDVLERIAATEPDIVGVSATFGQHDLMTALLDQLTTRLANGQNGPMLVAGGSLTVRNERLLLDRYPRLLIARGAGEPTIQDVLALWHGDLPLDHVRGIGYHDAPPESSTSCGGVLQIGKSGQGARRTATVANRLQTDIWPELDLLPETFRHGGVAQLESSRGCVSFCSFCPRGHKGSWAGADPDDLTWVLGAYRAVFDQFPDIPPILYLVDEEFIGRDADAMPRALRLASVLQQAKLEWETSCRIDQVARTDRDRDWHLGRAALWRALIARGLRRCLFGVESGVTSILQRFNKETTGEQNALAIRTLSALGVPTRFTYITFDQLMSLDELAASHAFQGRTDLLLRPLPHLDVAAIVDGVRDEAFVAEHATGEPFHTAISYMLVSMECLVGAAYTRQAAAHGLTGDADPMMGRVQARFADPRIGVASRWAQLWVDRSFPFDYTLKSLEKVLTGSPRRHVHQMRSILKHAASGLLGDMLALLTSPDAAALDELDRALQRLAHRRLTDLIGQMTPAVPELCRALPDDRAAVLAREHHRWATPSRWRLINAADPCST
ncbi:cobalamin B12-binding domain-containing protein [Actinomadura graeca]|uniref:Cobalamin B12-binding domain-containing protein n=1 Tax=Actinomadura graeca TaxID=2750812 RepID=A0ABX8R489_9ACTN|nr:cobalamin-dependent protein [Actinomadura graeca]QXJ25874.1 cobalamin B12-binding domain-containing protein [Actinomadura graeca]